MASSRMDGSRPGSSGVSQKSFVAAYAARFEGPLRSDLTQNFTPEQLSRLAVECPVCPGGRCLAVGSTTPPPPELLPDRPFNEDMAQWFLYRSAGDVKSMRPLMLCELHLMHRYPVPIPKAEVTKLQPVVRTLFNRLYAKQATIRTQERLRQLDELNNANKRMRRESVQARAEIAELNSKVGDTTWRAQALAMAASETRDMLLLGRDPGAVALAALRAVPHRESCCGPAECVHPAVDPLVLFSEGGLETLDSADDQLSLDFVFGGAGVQ